jgi:crotonobetainyl-CoA:carnitine CoA-transferase CaiB-like acyl-CoA transferase
MAGALEGVKVLEVSEYVAMPAASAILADWGASVIKVENIKGGDPIRGLTSVEGFSVARDVHVWWEQTNRNKKSIAIDLWQEEGREIVCKLAQNSDVFATNFTPPVIERFQIGYETLSKINPRLVYAHLTGFGKAGPDRDKPGYDYVAFWAYSGIMSRMGPPGTPPPPQRPGLGDNLTAGFITGAIAAALYAREKTGKGQALDFSLYNYGVWGLSMDIMPALIQGEELSRTDRKKVSNPLWNSYETKDGTWLYLMCLQSERYWPQFCRALGIEHLENDPNYHSHQKREQNNVELISIIESIISTRTYAELEDSFTKAGEIIYGRVQTPLEVVNNPQALANDFFPEVEHPSGRKIKLVASPAKFSETPASIRSTAPEMGQHTEEILLDIGYGWENIVSLKDKGVII